MGLPAQPATGLELAGISGPDSPSQYLTFSLAGEMFAVGILNVKEIIECGHLTAIPMMPTFIRGVINLRGSVVPVIDLAARFGASKTEILRRTCIIIVEVSDAETRHDIGIMVDAVSEVLDIPPAEIDVVAVNHRLVELASASAADGVTVEFFAALGGG